jgi:hypothetical protein
MKRNLRPVSLQYPLAIRVNFAMKYRYNPGLLKAEVESADPSKERRDPHMKNLIVHG